jgi:hypothetical protein
VHRVREERGAVVTGVRIDGRTGVHTPVKVRSLSSSGRIGGQVRILVVKASTKIGVRTKVDVVTLGTTRVLVGVAEMTTAAARAGLLEAGRKDIGLQSSDVERRM